MGGSGTGTPTSSSPVFVVEDGTGLSTANSYLSVADADTYHANITRSTNWSSATQTEKENALIVATQYLDIRFQGRWRGYRNTRSQALSWPRYSVEDDDGYVLDATALPQKLQDACAEMALRVVLGDDLLGTVTETGEVVSESVSVGPISESKTYAGGKPYGYEYPKLDALVRGLIAAGDTIIRG
ncbi:MAG: hypothetical protein RBS72_22010 [Sedimentisphaerales bacterium]|jgi:hypothetical protein|nr:hypothetical protein [Sedimentisphaerales bacterium]HNY81066.1 hypothetical protein [Sedimentisphaerales bacterium]HOI35843.1 hypothetical protein [Bacillota bacterium]